jgi:hypothetical protein
MKPRQQMRGYRKSRLRRWLGLEKFEHRLLLAGPDLGGGPVIEDAVMDSAGVDVGMDVGFDIPGEGAFIDIGLGSNLTTPDANSTDLGYPPIENSIDVPGDHSNTLTDDFTTARGQNSTVDLITGSVNTDLADDEIRLLLPQPSPSLPPLNEIPDSWPIDPDFGGTETTWPGPGGFNPEGSLPGESTIGEGLVDVPPLEEVYPGNPSASENKAAQTGTQDNNFQRSLAASVTVEPYVRRSTEDSDGVYMVYPGSDIRGEGESIRLIEGSKLYAAAQRQDAAIASVYRQRTLSKDANRIVKSEASDAESPTPTLQGSPSMLVFQWSASSDEGSSAPANDSVLWQPQQVKPNGSETSAIGPQSDVSASDLILLQETDESTSLNLVARVRQTISGPTVLVALGALVHTWFFGSQFEEKRPGYETERLPPKRKRKPF